MSPRRQRRGREDDARGARYWLSERAINAQMRDRGGARDEEKRDGGRVASRASPLAAPRIQNHPSNSQKIKRAFARRGGAREGIARTSALALLLFLFFAAILRACAESFGVKSRCVEGVGAAGRARRSFHRTSTEPLSIFVTGPKPERGTSRFDGFASVFANRFRGVFSSLGHAKRRFRVDSEIDSANHVRLSRCQSGTSAFVAFRGLLAWCGARRPPNRVPRLTSHRKKRMAAVSMTFRAAVAAPAKLLAAKPSARASATAKVGPPPIIRHSVRAPRGPRDSVD